MHILARVFIFLIFSSFTFEIIAAGPNGSQTPGDAGWGTPANCGEAVQNEVRLEKKHGAQEAPPSADIRFDENRFINVAELPGRPEIALANFASFSLANPNISVATAEQRAALTNVLIPVTPEFPLNAEVVASGVREGYFFYYPFKEANPYQRYENPASRAIISLDYMMKRLSQSDFVWQVKNKSHMKPPGAKQNAEKTMPMFRVSFNDHFDEVVEGAANADRLARDPKTKALLLRDGKPFFTNDTWITPETIALYKELFKNGHAFSVSVWRTIYDPGPREVLAGGAIGLCIDGFYSSETLFTNHDPMPGFAPGDAKNEIGNGVAGKLAIFAMFDYLQSKGVKWVDAQTVNDTTGRMGAQYIPRDKYMPLLKEALANPNVITFPSPREAYQVRYPWWAKEALQQKLQEKLASGQPLLLVH